MFIHLSCINLPLQYFVSLHSSKTYRVRQVILPITVSFKCNRKVRSLQLRMIELTQHKVLGNDSTLLREGHDKQHPNIWQSPLVSIRIRCTVSYNSARVHDDDDKLINYLTDWLNNSMEQCPSQSIRFLQTPLKRRHSSTRLHGVTSQTRQRSSRIFSSFTFSASYFPAYLLFPPSRQSDSFRHDQAVTVRRISPRDVTRHKPAWRAAIIACFFHLTAHFLDHFF